MLVFEHCQHKCLFWAILRCIYEKQTRKTQTNDPKKVCQWWGAFKCMVFINIETHFINRMPSRHMSPFQPCLHPETHEPLTWLQPMHAWWHCSEQSCPKNPCKQTGSAMKINLKLNLSFYKYRYKIPNAITNNTQLITFSSYGKVKWYYRFRIIVSNVLLLNIFLFITIVQLVFKERYRPFFT